MEAAYEFIDLYKQLEDALENRPDRGDPRRGSVVMDYINSAEGAPFRERLNLCREIRNLMAHNADVDGEPPVTPSAAVIESLRDIVEAVKRPRAALSCATAAEKLLVARLDDRAVPLMKKMEKKGFSHVPVMERGAMIGVFSVSTVFSAGLMGRRFTLTESACIRDFEALLPPESHMSERFCFLAADATLPEAAALFERHGGERERRVAAVFLTEGGGRTGELRGMLTPWDVLKAGGGR